MTYLPQPNTHSGSHADGGTDEISVAGLSGELADNQPPKSHVIDSHGVGSIVANYFPMNVGGSIVSSSGQTAKAQQFEATSNFRVAQSYIYGGIAYAAYAGGMLVLNTSSTADEPLKIASSAPNNALGQDAVFIGGGRAGTNPVFNSLCIGWWDSGGPTRYNLYQFKTDGLIQATAANINSEYMVPGGAMTYDSLGDRLITGFQDDFNNSDLHPDWTAVQAAGTPTAVEDGTDLTVTLPSGSAQTYRISRPLPCLSGSLIMYSDLNTAVNDYANGIGIMITTAPDFFFLQHYRESGSPRVRLGIYKSSIWTWIGSAVINASSWLRLDFNSAGLMTWWDDTTAPSAIYPQGNWEALGQQAPLTLATSVPSIASLPAVFIESGTWGAFSAVTTSYRHHRLVCGA